MIPSSPKTLSETPEFSVIVVTYGAREMTLRCLESVAREMPDIRHEVVIVDNASSDGLADELAQHFPQFRVIASRVNLGFAAGANLGAQNSHGKYLLFLNPDTLLLPSTMQMLMTFARRRPSAGIWGGRTLFDDRSLNPMSCWRRPTLWNLLCNGLALDTRFPNSPLFHSAGYGGWNRDDERDVDVISGCFLLIDKSLWERLGGFAPEFFMYGEDIDLCIRARKLGAQPALTPSAIIIHHGSGTEANQLRKIGQVMLAKALLIRRHFRPVLRPMALWLLMLRPALGRRFARADLRDLWEEIWTARQQWR